MRKFRFVGDPDEYDIKDNFPELWDREKIFDGDLFPKYWDFDIKTFAKKYPEDWQDMTEPEPLHKDTDLGYFAGEVIRGLMTATDSKGNWTHDISSAVEISIRTAKELIKQLNETGRN